MLLVRITTRRYKSAMWTAAQPFAKVTGRTLVLALLAACGQEKDQTSGDAGTSEATGTTSNSTTANSSTGESPTGGPTEEFGFTCLDLSQGESVEGDPFAGTYKIVLKLDYLPCLKSYYLDKHPEQRLDGKDGPAVFAEWKERLCSEAVARRIDCTVESFEQTLITTGAEEYSLAVTYITPNPGDLVGGKILWGPGPLPDYAECDPGDVPFAALTKQSGITGQNKAGKVLWQAQSFTDNKGVMQLSGGGCIQARIAPVN